MSVFNDIQIRSVLNSKLLSIGTGTGNKRTLDLSFAGITGISSAEIQIVSGEYTTEPKDQKKVWIEPFTVKSPQIMYTPTVDGISKKKLQYTIWVKTLPEDGLFYNEVVSGAIEQHFKDNEHLPTSNGDMLTILKSYQQPTITVDSTSGRLFNRVFIDTEMYYNTQN